VAGNGTLENVTRNARAVCTLAGIRDVPVAAGAARPLRRALEIAAHVHGRSAQADARQELDDVSELGL